LNLFISWSKSRSRAVASALRSWLPDMFQGLNPWLSLDINAGSRWATEVSVQLDACNCGILCVTPENIRSPWLLFEAGALSKALNFGKVIPYCYGVPPDRLPYPLAQFKGAAADRSGTYTLVQAINNVLEHGLTTAQLDRGFAKWWPDLERELQAVPSAPDPADEEDQPQLSDIANTSLFHRFYDKESSIVTSRVRQLRDGYLQLFSSEVERIEYELFDYMKEGQLTQIVAVDLATPPETMLTRQKRIQRRRQFIRSGGRICRLFVLDDRRVEPGTSYLDALESVLEIEENMGTEVGIRFLSQTKGELAQDFILYDGFAAFVEGKQPDAEYQIGSSTIFFKRDTLNAYRQVFEALWNAEAFNASAVNRLKEFRAFLKHSKGNTGFTNEIFRRDFVGR
jgi:hypothetical protein